MFNKFLSAFDLGGPNLVILKTIDMIKGSSKGEEYLQRVLEHANKEDYPRIIKDMYMYNTGERLNLEHPRSFNEKIQWLKLYDNTTQKTILSDKFKVRDWVTRTIGEEYLVPLLGVWDTFDEIDFDTLPNSFVLKCNHGSGMNYVVKDKAIIDKQHIKQLFDRWMNTNFAYHYFELQYKDIEKKIIAEKYIEQMDGDLLDYKIHVFNGEPRLIRVIGGRDMANHTAYEATFDINWNLSNKMYSTFAMFPALPSKPDNLSDLLEIASILGKGFRFVRVDLYDISGQIIFGEMTFTPSGGYGYWGDMDSVTPGSWIITE